MMLLIIAWRNIWRNRVRSAVVMTSVIVGIWAGTMVTALFWGLSEQRLDDAIRNEVSHIQLHRKEFKLNKEAVYVIPGSSAVISAIRQEAEVEAVSGRLVATGLALTATMNAGVLIKGILPEDEALITGLDRTIIEGKYFPPAANSAANARNGALVGARLADKLKVKLGSRIVLTFIDKTGEVASAAFRIRGIYRSSNEALDERNVYVQQPMFAELLQTGDDVHEIAVLLKSNDAQTPSLAKFRRLFPSLLVESWREIAPPVAFIVDMGSVLSTLVLIFILLALAFGVINTMLMAMLERSHEIGVMMAIGMNKIRLFLLVVYETVLILVIASIPGILLAYVWIERLGEQGIDLSQFGDALRALGLTVIYPKLSGSEYGEIVILVILTALLASIFPARRALSINPTEAIRK